MILPSFLLYFWVIMNSKIVKTTIIAIALSLFPSIIKAQTIIYQQGAVNATATGNSALSIGSLRQTARQQVLGNSNPAIISQQQGRLEVTATGNSTGAIGSILQHSVQTTSGQSPSSPVLTSTQEALVNVNARNLSIPNSHQ